MHPVKKILLSLLSIGLLTGTIHAGITGNWVTYDDKTGKKKSIVKITKHGNTISGTIQKLFSRPATTKCVKCKGKLHNKPIVGMTIFSGLKLKKGKWQGGKILDPKNGKWYTCKIWQEGANLKVRGFILMFYRTQTWRRK